MRTKVAGVAGICLAVVFGPAEAGERSDVRAGTAALAKPAARVQVTAEQRHLLAEKLAIADRLMRIATEDRELSADHRIWLLESMYRLPLADLQSIGTPPGYEATIRALGKAAKARQKLGAASTELVYYPITPCRYIDTQSVGGPLVNNVARGFDLSNNGMSYGGSSSCNPKTAVGNNEDAIGALSINVAIYAPTAAPGVVGARKPGTLGSTALVNWYNTGPTVQVSNAAVVTTDQNPATANEIEFIGSPTHIIVDIFGVFAAPSATPLDCTNGTETSTAVNTTARDFNLFASACPASYQMMSNSCQTTALPQDIVLAGGGVFVGGSNCFGYYSGTGSEIVYNAPWCCRIPGR